MANTRKVESAEILHKYINDFIAKCIKTGEIPSDYNLCKFLDISGSTLDRYKSGEGTYKGYDAPLKTLTLYREHRLLERLESDPRAATATIFELKQSKNGGYTDSPLNTGDGSATIKLEIAGVGGPDAFK